MLADQSTRDCHWQEYFLASHIITTASCHTIRGPLVLDGEDGELAELRMECNRAVQSSTGTQ